MAKRMPTELVTLERRVQRWRQRRGGLRERIPEHLWAEAVAVARTAGLHQTSKVLRFHYGALKKRAARALRPTRLPKPEFVAVEMPQVQHEAKVVVDLVRRDGSQMRVETVATGLDVASLVASFLRRAS